MGSVEVAVETTDGQSWTTALDEVGFFALSAEPTRVGPLHRPRRTPGLPAAAGSSSEDRTRRGARSGPQRVVGRRAGAAPGAGRSSGRSRRPPGPARRRGRPSPTTPISLISRAIRPATTGAENDVPLQRAMPVLKTRMSPLSGVSLHSKVPSGKALTRLRPERVDVGGDAVVGELRDPAVAVERADADAPVEGGRPEGRRPRVVAGGGHEHAVPLAQARAVERLERDRGQVHAACGSRPTG